MTSVLHIVRLSLVLMLLLTVRGVSARSVTDFEKHTTAAQGLYAEKNYDGAIGEFTAAYQLAPEPWLLINIGRCHYLADRPKDALGFYNKALQGKLDRSEREEVMASVAKATIKLQEQQERAVNEQRKAEQARLTALASASLIPSNPPEKPFHKKAWFWGVIGGSLSLLTIGLGVGLGVGLRPSTVKQNPDNVIQ